VTTSARNAVPPKASHGLGIKKAKEARSAALGRIEERKGCVLHGGKIKAWSLRADSSMQLRNEENQGRDDQEEKQRRREREEISL
jgi:hypothetical protein